MALWKVAVLVGCVVGCVVDLKHWLSRFTKRYRYVFSLSATKKARFHTHQKRHKKLQSSKAKAVTAYVDIRFDKKTEKICFANKKCIAEVYSLNLRGRTISQPNIFEVTSTGRLSLSAGCGVVGAQGRRAMAGVTSHSLITSG